MQHRGFIKESVFSSAGLLAVPSLLKAAVRPIGSNVIDRIGRDFLNPPDSARPRVFWRSMNGNITKEGMTLDLETMKRMG